jgi:hypothetical protein
MNKKDKLRRSNVNISERDKEKAIKIGGGISKGIRKALEKYKLTDKGE